MPSYEYRLVRLTYVNRLEYEDGPGSLTNVVSGEPQKRTLRIWHDRDENFGKGLVAHGFKSYALISSSEDGWIEYSYRLERRLENSADAEWEYVASIPSNCAPEEEHDEYSRYERESEDDDREE